MSLAEASRHAVRPVRLRVKKCLFCEKSMSVVRSMRVDPGSHVRPILSHCGAPSPLARLSACPRCRRQVCLDGCERSAYAPAFGHREVQRRDGPVVRRQLGRGAVVLDSSRAADARCGACWPPDAIADLFFLTVTVRSGPSTADDTLPNSICGSYSRVSVRVASASLPVRVLP